MKSEKRAQKSILMTRHYPDLGGASGWICEANFQPIRSTTQIRGMTRHQYGISVLVSHTSFRGQITSGVAKCRLFYWLRADNALTHALNDCLALGQLTSPSQSELKCLHGEKLAKLGGRPGHRKSRVNVLFLMQVCHVL